MNSNNQPRFAVLLAAGRGERLRPYTDTTPKSLSLKLRMATVTNKYTYFELEEDGQLRYGGGRMAMRRSSR